MTEILGFDQDNKLIVRAPMGEALSIAQAGISRGFKPRPFKDIIKSRLTYSQESRVFTDEILVGESVLYIPGSRPRVLPASVAYIRDLEIIASQKADADELWVSEGLAKEVAKQAVEFAQEPSIVRTRDLHRNYLTRFLFGSQELAQKYASLLQKKDIMNIELKPLDETFVNKQPRPFIRGMLLEGVPDGSGIKARDEVILGTNYWNNLDYYVRSS